MNEPRSLTTVVLVEDDEPLRLATAQALELAGFAPQSFASAERAYKQIRDDFAGCIVTDIRMEGMDGLALMKAVSAVDPELPVILVTGHGDVAMAVAALKDGAFDFLAKPFSADQLAASVRRALQARALVLDNRRLRRDAEQAGAGELIGVSEAMAKLRATVGQMAMIDLDVLIEGESGTGKELVARALHRQSTRALKPFVALRCSSLGDYGPAERFGGDLPASSNVFERAAGGVLFLDEIEALSLPLQGWLLAHLEERERRGDGEPTSVRVIAATRAILEDEVRGGRVREDLVYRLGMLRVRVPPLRERREDVPLLFANFVREALDKTRRKRFEMSAADRRRLLEYDWPGNARELRSYAYNAVLNLPRIPSGDRLSQGGLSDRVAAFERVLLIEALQQAGGKISLAGDLLRISRQTLYEKIARHHIDIGRYRKRPQDVR